MYFSQHYLACLSHASYLIGDEGTGRAVVVDPQRDVGTYVDEAAAHGLRIERVIETHLHADFLSGHLELAAATGATISFGRGARVDFPIEPLSDGQVVQLGDVRLEIRETPGHTPESICVVVYEHADDAVPYGVLTGDTLFVGDVGRPDLLASSGAGLDAGTLGRLLYRSLQDQILTLPDVTRVFPAHGAGSSCGKQLSSETSSTIGEQRRSNYALQPMSEDDFVAAVTEGQPVRPHYFTFDAKRNREQRTLLEERAPPPMRLATVLDAVEGGAVALDTREPTDFASGHLAGAINVGLDGRFAEWSGDVLDPERPIVLVGDPATALESRVRLGRIGFDAVVGYLEDPGELFFDRPDLVEASSRVTIEQLAELVGLLPTLQLVDVRNPGETEVGVLSGSRVIPLPILVDSLAALDRAAPVVVTCASGYRSMTAASVLRHEGFEDVSDLVGGFGAWTTAGLPIELGDTAPAAGVQAAPLAADELLRSGAVAIDVREQDEWAAGHIAGSVLIPMGQVESRAGEVLAAHAAVIVCRSGGRSNAVAQLLARHGVDAVNLEGGLLAWQAEGLPLVTDEGGSGQVL